MKRKDIIYCQNCGKRNKKTDKICKHCGKKLYPKFDVLREFMYNHIKDYLIDEVKDTPFSLLKNFIKSNLYGTVCISLVVFVGVSAIVVNVNKEEYKKIEEVPVPTISKACEFEDTHTRRKVCEEGFTLSNDKCVRTITVTANQRNNCPNGYSFSGNQCVSNENVASNVDMQCLLPNQYTNPPGWYKADLNPFDGTCYLFSCNPDNGVCLMTDEIGFTPVYSCPTGTTNINGQCKRITNSTAEYYCDNGTLNNNVCSSSEEKDYTLSCDEGYTYNKNCKVCVKE